MESILPDSRAYRIIRDVIAPEFKNADYASGIYAGIYEAGKVIASDKGTELKAETTGGERRLSKRALTTAEKIKLVIFLLIFIPVIIKNPWLLFFILSSGRGSYRGGGFGGSGSGGFGGFGGGSSGGGGASGGW